MLVGQNERVHTGKWQFAPHVIDLEASVIREILKISSRPGIINFAGGLPAPELFPLDDMNRALAEAIDKYGPLVMQYSLSKGITPFRELIARRATARGTQSATDNILITSGAQQGIELVARAFIDPGDYVLTENPTYLGALQAFNYYRANYATVEMDDQGMIIDQVEERIARYKPKFIYTVSNFQNPTGISMSDQRRRDLVELATLHDIPIIDDNPYGEIRFDGDPLPTLKSYGGDGVIAIRSFSKILAPGLRIGWMNGPSKIMGQFEKVKQCADLHTSSLIQYMVYMYVLTGKLEPHIEEIKNNYRTKRDLMMSLMKEEFVDGIRWTKPEGGMFIWGELPGNVDARTLLDEAVKRKVAYVPGASFYPNGGGENTFRLNFSNASDDDMVEGIARLGKLFRERL